MAAITSAMRTQVVQLYVSLFGRAPDGEGLGFWTGALASKSLATVAQEMYDSAPARAYYPSFLTNQEVVEKFYVNVLGRTADADGLAFWLKAMNAPGATKGGVIASMIDAVNNYSGSDAAGVASKALFVNKVAVAEFYGLQNNAAGSSSILANVTSDAATVDAAKNEILHPTVAGQTFTLTNGVNNGASFTGGSGADTFNAALDDTNANTLNNLDAIDGGAGVDTLNVAIASSVTPASLANIENVVATFSVASKTLNLTNGAAVSSVESQSSTQVGTFSNIAAGANLAVTDQDAIGATFAYKTTAGTQSANLSVDNVTNTGVITIAGIETINVTSGTSANKIDLTVAAATTINVSGSADLTLVNLATNAAAVTSLSATAMTGALDMGAAGGAALVTINGGSGNDSLYGTSSVANNIDAGAGDDTLVFAANLTSADTVAGGDGTDILSADASIVDNLFTNITSVETLTLTAGGSVTVGAAAQAAGLVTINGSTVADTVSATAYTVGITYVEAASQSADSVVLGAGNDVFVFKGNLALSANDTLDGNAGTDVIRLNNSTGAVTAEIDFDNVTDIEQIVVYDSNGTTTGSAQAINLTISGLDLTAGGVGVSSITIDGSVITDASDALLITNNLASAGLTFSITGGAGNDSLAGASGADTISGGAGADTINGDSGNDVLSGNAGKDTITAGAGNDSIDGGTENDTIIVAGNLTSADSITGGDGVDIMSITAGSSAVDLAFTNVTSIETLTLTTGGSVTLGAKAEAAGIVTINGSTVADTVSATAYTVGITYVEAASQSADSVALGAGNDVFVFSGLLALSANDTLDGNGGTDVIRLDNSAGAVSASIDFDNVTDIEQIVVYDSNGTATATAENVNIVIEALSATSGVVAVKTITIDGSVIADASDSLTITNSAASTVIKFSITGGAGNDSLAGASGADTISGGAGNDTISGDSGNDVLSGDAGKDTITGGVGNDTITGGDGSDNLSGEDGNDVISGGADNDTITAGDGNDSVDGGDGNDTIVFAGNLTLDDTIVGGDGTDTLSVSGTIVDSGFLSVTGVETLSISASSTVDIGARAQNAGIVTINGSTVADTVSATAYTVGITYVEAASQSADSVALGAGNDVFVFSGLLALSANDTLDGNGGTDVIRLDNSAGAVSASIDFDNVTDIEQIVVYDSNGTATATAENVNIVIEALSATSGVVAVKTITIDGSVIADASDSLTITNSAASTVIKFSITGGAGNDSLAGASGADTISGGAGADTISGDSGNDVLTGDAGADTITGGAGNDTITGGADNDSINGGAGVDNLTGGAGSDTFNITDVATSRFMYDTITDLSAGDSIVFANASGTETFTATAITLGAAAGFSDYLNEAANDTTGTTTNAISWFTYGGNTYIVQDISSGSSTFVDGTDIIVEITGVVNLADSTISSQTLTIV